MAISSPIASAISLPLNHLARILETVVPAISHPQPKIMKPNMASLAEAGMVTHQEPSHAAKSVVWNQSEMPTYLMAAPITMRLAESVPVKRTPILSRIIPAMMRNPNTLSRNSPAA